MKATDRIILNILSEHADRGQVCPGDDSLALQAGIAEGSVPQVLRRLENDGHIRRLIRPRSRRIEIVATGKRTGVPTNGRIVPKKATDPDDAEVAEAKTILRRRHTAVFRADVTGGPVDRWIVGMREVDRSGLLKLARKAKRLEKQRRAA